MLQKCPPRHFWLPLLLFLFVNSIIGTNAAQQGEEIVVESANSSFSHKSDEGSSHRGGGRLLANSDSREGTGNRSSGGLNLGNSFRKITNNLHRAASLPLFDAAGIEWNNVLGDSKRRSSNWEIGIGIAEGSQFGQKKEKVDKNKKEIEGEKEIIEMENSDEGKSGRHLNFQGNLRKLLATNRLTKTVSLPRDFEGNAEKNVPSNGRIVKEDDGWQNVVHRAQTKNAQAKQKELKKIKQIDKGQRAQEWDNINERYDRKLVNFFVNNKGDKHLRNPYERGEKSPQHPHFWGKQRILSFIGRQHHRKSQSYEGGEELKGGNFEHLKGKDEAESSGTKSPHLAAKLPRKWHPNRRVEELVSLERAYSLDPKYRHEWQIEGLEEGKGHRRHQSEGDYWERLEELSREGQQRPIYTMRELEKLRKALPASANSSKVPKTASNSSAQRSPETPHNSPVNESPNNDKNEKLIDEFNGFGKSSSKGSIKPGEHFDENWRILPIKREKLEAKGHLNELNPKIEEHGKDLMPTIEFNKLGENIEHGIENEKIKKEIQTMEEKEKEAAEPLEYLNSNGEMDKNMRIENKKEENAPMPIMEKGIMPSNKIEMNNFAPEADYAEKNGSSGSSNDDLEYDVGVGGELTKIAEENAIKFGSGIDKQSGHSERESMAKVGESEGDIKRKSAVSSIHPSHILPIKKAGAEESIERRIPAEPTFHKKISLNEPTSNLDASIAKKDATDGSQYLHEKSHINQKELAQIRENNENEEDEEDKSNKENQKENSGIDEEIARKNAKEISQENAKEIAQKNAEEIDQKNSKEIAQKNAREIDQKNANIDVPIIENSALSAGPEVSASRDHASKSKSMPKNIANSKGIAGYNLNPYKNYVDEEIPMENLAPKIGDGMENHRENIGSESSKSHHHLLNEGQRQIQDKLIYPKNHFTESNAPNPTHLTQKSTFDSPEIDAAFKWFDNADKPRGIKTSLSSENVENLSSKLAGNSPQEWTPSESPKIKEGDRALSKRLEHWKLRRAAAVEGGGYRRHGSLPEMETTTDLGQESPIGLQHVIDEGMEKKNWMGIDEERWRKSGNNVRKKVQILEEFDKGRKTLGLRALGDGEGNGGRKRSDGKNKAA